MGQYAIDIASVTGDSLWGDWCQPSWNYVYEMRKHIGMIFKDPIALLIHLSEHCTTRAGRIGTKKGLRQQLPLKQAPFGIQVKDDLHKSALTLSGEDQRLALCSLSKLTLSCDGLSLLQPALDLSNFIKLEKTMFELKNNYTIIIGDHNLCSRRHVQRVTYTGFSIWSLIEPRWSDSIFQIFIANLNDWNAVHFGWEFHVDHNSV